MRRRSLFLNAFALLAFFGAPILAQAQDNILRFGHTLSPSHATAAFFLTPWADKLTAESNGQLRVTMRAGLDPAALTQALANGELDGAFIAPDAGAPSTLGAITLPFIAPSDPEAASSRAWALVEPTAPNRALAVQVSGPAVLHLRRDSSTALEDMIGLRIFAQDAEEMAQALEFNVSDIPAGQLRRDLGRKRLDGALLPWADAIALRVHERSFKHVELGNRMPAASLRLLVIREDAFAALPGDLKALLEANAGPEASAWAGRALKDGAELMAKGDAGRAFVFYERALEVAESIEPPDDSCDVTLLDSCDALLVPDDDDCASSCCRPPVDGGVASTIIGCVDTDVTSLSSSSITTTSSSASTTAAE